MAELQLSYKGSYHHVLPATAVPWSHLNMVHSGSSFTSGERLGLSLLAGTSAVSACAVVCLLSYIVYSAVCIVPGSSRRWQVRGPVEVYFLNQLVWDLVQASGGLMNIKWATDATVQPGTYCSAQGAIKQLSDVGSAMSSLIISLFTLRVVCFWRIGRTDTDEKDHKRKLIWSVIVVASLWIALGVLVGVNMAVSKNGRFYAPTGYWCWISAEYSVQRTATDFAFIWTTASCSIVVYGMLFLYLKGYITTDGWRVRVRRHADPLHVHGHLRQAYGLLFYPLVYILTILPLSAARYTTFAHHQVPFAVTCFCDAIYLSNGLLNVLLFSFTRPHLLPHDPEVPNFAPQSRRSRTTTETHNGDSLWGERSFY
ncbi:hypothetical protein F5148DRAFT_473829 [Russula earlei]|uniref:Uncharacterized protein n=1 Tax=Russula earlei TaxID=71964 RepID=A0ACC0UHE5_9AGAM|nr:hypothetical protein F5148DRAFT_473829 [Russula earlei]